MTSNQFDIEINKLRIVPKRNWFDGRRTPTLTLISNVGRDIITKNIESFHQSMRLIIFQIDQQEYIYIEVTTESSGPPIIESFQLEKFINKGLDSNVLLSSDDLAQPMGRIAKIMLDKI